MTFEITTTRSFSAAHQLRLYDGTLEPLHGHNWRAKVVVATPRLDGIGVVMDFHELERLVDAIVLPMHNSNLNDAPAFKEHNPTAENVAAHVFRMLRLPSNVALSSVEIWETDTNSAVCRA